jgi:hypothetical protein
VRGSNRVPPGVHTELAQHALDVSVNGAHRQDQTLSYVLGGSRCRGAAQGAADELTRAATEAMAAGYSLTEIARAEARGKDTVRRTLRGDALKLVEHSGTRARQA